MGPPRLAWLLTPLACTAGLWAAAAGVGSAAPESVLRAAVTQHVAQAGTVGPQGEADRRRRRRPSCGRFCRQAGGFGAGPNPAEQPVRIRRQRVRVASDGIIAIRATCRIDKKCIGAILVDGRSVSYGRADLRIPARSTRRVLVAVGARGIRYLRRHGRDRRGFATVPLIYDDMPVSVSARLTILAPR